MRIGSLFSGAGGLDRAALELFPDSSMAWHSEVDPAASRVLAYRWPGAPNLGDVKAVDWRSVERVDVVTGGYPCQPFSSAGQKKGTDDERHLWPYVREAIRVLRPRFALLENVAGHRSLGFDRVLADMAADGLDAAWCSVRASDVGAAHRRERLFILAFSPDAEGVGPQGGNGISGSTQTCPVGQWESAGGVGRDAAVALLPTPSARDYKGQSVRAPIRRSGDVRTDSDVQLPNAALALDGDWGIYQGAIARQERLSRPAPDPIEHRAQGKPRLSAQFSEWLMWLPSGWVTDPGLGLSYSAQLRIIGNGVCPPQAVAACRYLIDVAEQVRA